MALPFVSLDAVSATGAGAASDLQGSFARHTVIVSTTGSPSSLSVALEGSHDEVTWFTLVNAGNPGGGTTAQSVSTHLVRYVRANLTSLSGGSSPTVTASIASDTIEED